MLTSTTLDIQAPGANTKTRSETQKMDNINIFKKNIFI